MKKSNNFIGKVFETDRLVLRKLSMRDVDNLQKIFSDSTTMQYYSKVLNSEEIKVLIHHALETYKKYKTGVFACLLKSSGEFVGQCGLFFVQM